MAELVTIARPYAEAAFKLAREKSNLAGWSQMLALLSSRGGGSAGAGPHQQPQPQRATD